MTRTLQKIGNSKGLLLNRTMLEHLGVTDTVDVNLEEGRIVITPPRSKRQAFEEASRATFAEYDGTMRRLADAG